MPEKVILVDENDHEVGTEEKIIAHQSAKLHRAFSIFIFNSEGKLLLQKRVKEKYHSGGLWTNTCCGHPRPGEDTETAAHRRLQEEMGFDCELKEILHFTYRVKLDKKFYENEYDHVFTGAFNENPTPASEEVDDWRWCSLEKINKEIKESPGKYTYWLPIALMEMKNKERSHSPV